MSNVLSHAESYVQTSMLQTARVTVETPLHWYLVAHAHIPWSKRKALSRAWEWLEYLQLINA